MFIPKKVYIEKEALDYKLGKELQRQFLEHGVPVEILENNRVNFLRGKTPQEKYETGKRVLVVGVRRTLEFQSCKPSAHYQLPLVTGCIGKCCQHSPVIGVSRRQGHHRAVRCVEKRIRYCIVKVIGQRDPDHLSRWTPILRC